MKKRDYNQHHSHNGVEHQTRSVKQNNKSVLKKLKFFLLAILILIILFFIIFKTPLFKINKIIISGTTNVESVNQTEKEIKDYFKNNSNHILLLNSKELVEFIKQQIRLEKVVINKKFSDKLIVKITPYIPAILWQEGNNYFLIDSQGRVETQINLSQLEWELPIVTAATTTKVIIHQQLVNENFIGFIREFNKNFNKINLTFKIEKYILPNLQGREVWAITNSGWKIILTTANNIQTSVDILKALIKEKFTDSQPMEYVDLRLEEKVFYK